MTTSTDRPPGSPTLSSKDKATRAETSALALLRSVCLAVGLLTVAGCAPSLTAGNERGGVVDHVIGLDRDQAFAIADAHCRKYGRVARISGQDTLASTLTFDCVAP